MSTFWQRELITHSLFLSITRLTRMALCSEYSLHTPIWEISKKVQVRRAWFLPWKIHSFILTTHYCRRNTTHFLSNLQWSLRQLFCAPSPEQIGRPCELKCKRKIQHDLLTGIGLHKSLHFQFMHKLYPRAYEHFIYIIHNYFQHCLFKCRFCKSVNFYKKVKPQTNLGHIMFFILYICHWVILFPQSF